MTTTLKTRKVAGFRMRLTAGQQYTASRPFAERGRSVYPVVIREGSLSLDGVVAWRFDNLNYDQACALVNAFNNGHMSFDGRVW